MQRFWSLIPVVAVVLAATATLPSEAPPPSSGANASRAATFVGVKDGETLFVERVRDAPGGFHGEVSVTKGSVWIRYRVELGPDESIRRYEMDMTPPETDGPRGIPLPILVARRTRDSILVEPELESGPFPGTRELVPPGAFIGSTEMAMFEQAIRFALRWNVAGANIQIVSAWTGKRLPATIDRRGDKVWLSTKIDSWEFKLDRHNRITSGKRIRGAQGQAADPWSGVHVVRLDPSGPNPIHQPLTIGESEEGRRRDRLDTLMQAWAQQLSAFRATLDSDLRTEELCAQLDDHIINFANRGGVYQAERCLEALEAFRRRPEAPTLAERYARKAVGYADAHQVINFGDQGMIEARVRSRTALARALAERGKSDSAIVLLEATLTLPSPYHPLRLRRDVLHELGDVLAAKGRTEEAIGALFEAVALDDTPDRIGQPLQRSLEDLWRREFPSDTTIASRIGRARGLNWPTFTMGSSFREPRGAAAPVWAARDLAGKRHAWRAGRPLVVVFWGGWSEPGRRMVRLAEEWYRQRRLTGVDVVTFNWELPGPGRFSEHLARRAVSSEKLTVPVLLDHDREIWSRFRGDFFPQVFFVDREGRIARTDFGGAWRSEGLSTLVEALGRGELH